MALLCTRQSGIQRLAPRVVAYQKQKEPVVTIEELRQRLAKAIRNGDEVEERAIRALLDSTVGPKAKKETR